MTVSWRQDLFLRDLFPVKLLLFLQAAGDFAVYPFFTLHMKSLGISLTEIGIQFALTPIATLLATPVMGMVADRIGNFKVMLATALVLCAIMANFIVMIPKIQMAPQCSLNQETIKLTCPGAQSDSNSDPF
ncbi:hypothetical protein HDE_13886 [Halotydeus destructor]|nr:hypothetical protein HDE_13886 [Halotydeus destructor]